MIFSLFKQDPALAAGEALYARIVEQSRREPFYLDYGAPDTVEGRFEMIALHAYLVLRRLRGEDGNAKDVAQCLFDAMFKNMDDALRELGVGDMAIGRKIRTLAENFYGRVEVYGNALDEGDRDALTDALARNVYEKETEARAADLAVYVVATDAALTAQPIDRLRKGAVQFPDPGEAA